MGILNWNDVLIDKIEDAVKRKKSRRPLKTDQTAFYKFYKEKDEYSDFKKHWRYSYAPDSSQIHFYKNGPTFSSKDVYLYDWIKSNHGMVMVRITSDVGFRAEGIESIIIQCSRETAEAAVRSNVVDYFELTWL
jgi:hypothetical protein